MIKVISTAESYRQMKHSIDCAVLNCFSPVRLFVTLWTVACQVPLSMGFFRQEYWSGLPCPPPGDLLNPGTEAASPVSPALAGGFFTTNATCEASESPTYELKELKVPSAQFQGCRTEISHGLFFLCNDIIERLEKNAGCNTDCYNQQRAPSEYHSTCNGCREQSDKNVAHD